MLVPLTIVFFSTLLTFFLKWCVWRNGFLAIPFAILSFFSGTVSAFETQAVRFDNAFLIDRQERPGETKARYLERRGASIGEYRILKVEGNEQKLSSKKNDAGLGRKGNQKRILEKIEVKNSMITVSGGGNKATGFSSFPLFMFDGYARTLWFHDNHTSGWVSLDLGKKYPSIIDTLKIRPVNPGWGGFGIKNFAFEGSDDNTQWEILYTGRINNEIDVSKWQKFKIPHTKPYRYFRLRIIDSYAIHIGIADIELYEILSGKESRQDPVFMQEASPLREKIRLDLNDFHAHISLGRVYQKFGFFDLATIEFKEALRINKDNFEAKIGLLKAYKEVLRLNPNNAKVHYDLGMIYKILLRRQDAAREFREAILHNPSFIQAHFELGEFYESVGRREDAIAEFKEIIRHDPNNILARMKVGLLYGPTKFGMVIWPEEQPKEFERWRKAAAEYKEILRIDPNNSEAISNLGLIDMESGRLQEAAVKFREAIRLNSNHFQSVYYLGIVNAKIGHWQKAIDQFSIILGAPGREQWFFASYLSRSATMHYELAKAYLETGVWQKAFNSYQIAYTRNPALAKKIPEDFHVRVVDLIKETLRLDPNNLQARIKLGEIYKELGRLQDAAVEFREAFRIDEKNINAHEGFLAVSKEMLRLDPKNVQARINLGLAFKMLGRLQDAAVELREALRLDEKKFHAYYNLGLIYKELDRLPEAVAEFREAIRLEPDNPQARFSLGLVLKTIGRMQDAATEFREVVRLEPNNLQALINLGQLNIQFSEWQKAAAKFVKVLQLDPGNLQAHYNLGIIYAKLGLWQKAIDEYSVLLEGGLEANFFGGDLLNSAPMHFTLAEAYLATGLWRKALIEYKTAINRDPAMALQIPKGFQVRMIGLLLALFFISICLAVYYRHQDQVSGLLESTGKAGHLSYRPDVDGLRAIAVLSVVVFHAYPQSVTGGFIGVDIFFVISGYLISCILFKSLESGSFSFWDFYGRRIKRIFPTFIVVLLAVWVVGWFVLIINDYKLLGKHMVAGAAFVLNFATWQEIGYFDTAAELKPLLHLWSLGVEEQYYLLWPLVLYFSWQRKVGPFALLCLLGATSFALNIWQVQSDTATAFFLPHTRMWELMAGGLLAWLEFKKTDPQKSFFSVRFTDGIGPNTAKFLHNGMAWTGLCLIVFAVVGLDKTQLFPGWLALAPVGGACLLIAAGCKTWVNQNILANRGFVLIGLISYPLYLWHWPLLSFSRIILAEEPADLVKIDAIVLSFILAWLTYRFVEKPIRFGKFRKVKIVVPALASIVVFLGLVGMATYFTNGFGWRFPESIQKIAAAQRDFAGSISKPSCDAGESGPDCVSENVDTNVAVKGEESGIPLVTAWGDCAAEQLYAGFEPIQKKFNFRFDRSGFDFCPPFSGPGPGPKGFFSDACVEHNELVVKKIIEKKHDTVMLAGFWHSYPEPEKQVVEVLSLLKKAGVRKIILFGPLPVWADSLQSMALDYMIKNSTDIIPERMTPHLGHSKTSQMLDKKFRAIADEFGVIYISPYELLCNADGCLARIGGELTTHDAIHLAPVAAKFLADKVYRNVPLN